MLGNPISVCGCFRSLSLCLTLPCNHTHMDTQIHTHTSTEWDKEIQRQRERGREVFTKWPFWILSKGFVSHYGDLENSPCTLIPLLLPWFKGIQWKRNEHTCLLYVFCLPLTEKIQLKNSSKTSSIAKTDNVQYCAKVLNTYYFFYMLPLMEPDFLLTFKVFLVNSSTGIVKVFQSSWAWPFSEDFWFCLFGC